MTGGRRLVGGLIVGAMLGALGPTLNAVAWHSGNDSGSSPVAVSADMLLEQHASATWLRGYAFDMSQWIGAAGEIAENEQSVAAGGIAEVVARGPACDETRCEQHVWRGTFPLPADPTIARIVIDPLATSASFSGVLTDEATDEPCMFDVSWPFRRPDVREATVALDGEREEHVNAVVTYDGSRADAGVRVHASCWPDQHAIDFGLGRGEVSSSTVAETDISRAHLCVSVPNRGRVCPLDD